MPSAGAAAPVPSRSNLQADINAWLGSHSGDKALLVYDATNGQSWSYNTGMVSYEASISKVDILATRLYQTQAHGPLSAADQALATKMIEQSGNAAATALYKEDGGPTGVAAFNAHTTGGMARTTMKAVDWGGSTTTVGDQLHLLWTVSDHNATLTDASRAYELNLMQNVIPADKFGATSGVPANVPVAVKNGWLPLVGTNSDWQINSLGWVHGGGRNYFVAYMSYRMPSYAYGTAVANGIGSRVYAHLTPPPAPAAPNP